MEEQWRTMGLCFSWITGAAVLEVVQKGLRGMAWQAVAARGFFSLGGQVFEKLGVIENILGSHTPKK